MAVSLANNDQFKEWLLYDGFPPPLELMKFEAIVAIAMCAVLRVWGAVSDAGEECVNNCDSAALRFVQTPVQINQLGGGIPGLSDAMEAVGWLEWDADSHAVFPGFLKHNTLKPKDVGAADRMRAYRQRLKASAVTKPVTQAQRDRNATRNCSSESESTSVSSSLPLPEQEDAEDRDSAPGPPRFDLHHLGGMAELSTPPETLSDAMRAIFGEEKARKLPKPHIRNLDRMIADHGVDDVYEFCAPRIGLGTQFGKVRDEFWAFKNAKPKGKPNGDSSKQSTEAAFAKLKEKVKP